MAQQPIEQRSAPWWAYTAPVAVFLALTQAERYLGPYPKAYSIKFVVTCLAMALCWPALRDIRPDRRVVPIAKLVGLAMFAVWVLIERWIPYPHIGTRTAFDPDSLLSDPAARTLFLVTRFFGLVLLVPLIEELFWRSFALRYLTNPDWKSVAPWNFSLSAFGLMCAGFALAHSEWLPAVICAAAYGLLLRQTRSLFACIVAHAVTNLALGIHILVTGNWKLW